MKIFFRVVVLWAFCVHLVVMAQTGNAIVPGFDSTRDIRNDDGTYTAPSGCTSADDGGTCPGTKIDLGFTVGFFGLSFSQVYINTNGNVTFDSPLASYTPFSLTSTNRQIIAPFFADVDTRNPLSGRVSFGQGTFGGRKAFGVNWIKVGYYYQRADKTNSFQLILVDRSDTGTGNFDIIFNYDSIQWESGEAPSSGGSGGLGGRSARAGYSNGTGVTGTFLELRGSSIPGSYLDSNSATGLIHGSLNNDIPGRYIFFARNGQVISGGLGVTGPCPLPSGVQGISYTPFSLTVSGGTPPYTATSVLPPGLTLDTTTFTVRGIPTASGSFPVTIEITDSAPGVLQQTRLYECVIAIGATAPPLQVTGPCTGGVQNRPYWVQLSVSGGSGGYSVSYNGPSWLAPAASAPSPGVYSYSLAGTPPSAGVFPVSVTVKDLNGSTGSYNCSILVTPSLTITSACPPAAALPIGFPFNYDFNAIGGTGNPAWMISRGQLPPGLSFSSAGKIFGAPSGPAGVSTFTVSAYSGEVSDEKTCSLTVASPPVRLLSGCPGNGAVGVPYGPFPLSASGGSGNYRYSAAGNFPDGLVFSNNVITGTPLRAGTFSFAVQVVSGDQTASTPPCIVTISPTPVEIAGSCPPALQQATVPLSASFTATGGQPPYRYALSGPAWLSQTNGTVTGTPPAAAQGGNAFTLTITDSLGGAASKTCVFNVSPPPEPFSVTGICPTALQARGAEINVPLSLIAGEPPFSWDYDNGIPSLTLASTAGQRNSLAGTLDREGVFAFQIGARDSQGIPARPLLCSVTVNSTGLPGMALTAGLEPADLLAPVELNLNLSSPAPVALNGSVALTFTPSAALPMDNPEVTFSNGVQTSFTVPAGSTSIPLGNLQRGTVSGMIHLEVKELSGAGGNVLPATSPTLDIAVPKLPPVFTVSVQDSSSGIDVVIKGYSTPRDILGGTITVNPRPGSSLQRIVLNLDSLNIDRLFADYYKTQTPSGSFDNFRIPVPVNGDKSEIESVTVGLTNSVGNSEVTQMR